MSVPFCHFQRIDAIDITAQSASTHDIKTPDDYTLHRISLGVPEGPIDIPPMHAFPMESNLDIMGGCK